MKNLTLQARAVSDPIKNPLIGWWCEYHIFYVKHRDLAERDVLTNMMLDPSQTMASLIKANTSLWTYCFDDGVDWVDTCLTRVVETWFRDDGETRNAYVITVAAGNEVNRPAAQINGDAWWQSVVDVTTLLTPIDPVIDQTPTADITASQIERVLRQWELLRSQGLTNQSYEDYLATFGVKPAKVELHRPELIRSLREWTYPTNTINPTTGAPTSAVSWATSERADKDRFFTEPGFIFGVTVMRPKVYWNKQSGAAVGMLNDVYSWLPAIMRDDPDTSLKQFSASEGALQATTNPYQIDARDLFLYGDQFINFDPTGTDYNAVSLPIAALTNKKYPLAADCDALFVSAAPANQVRQDGIVNLTILGTQEDNTPTGRTISI